MLLIVSVAPLTILHRALTDHTVAVASYTLLLPLLTTCVWGVELDNRTIPDVYSYHEEHVEPKVTREYLLHEMSPRTRLICPRNYFISSMTMVLQISEDYIKKNTPGPNLLGAFTHYLYWTSGDISSPIKDNPMTHGEYKKDGYFYDGRGKLMDSHSNQEPLTFVDNDTNKNTSQNILKERMQNNNVFFDRETKQFTFNKDSNGSTDYININDAIYGNDTSIEAIKSKCPTLARCLGYVGCIFTFGNEFCLGDPLPGNRKSLNVNVTCLQESQLAATAQADPLHGTARSWHILTTQEVHRRKEKIVNLRYRSRVESEVPDYSSTNVTGVESAVGDVMFGQCRKEGYAGECGGEVPPMERVGDELWHVLVRTNHQHCREQLLQVYCSYHYSPGGMCLPPYALRWQQLENKTDPSDLLPSYDLYPIDYKRPRGSNCHGQQCGGDHPKDATASSSSGSQTSDHWTGQQEAYGHTIPDILRPVRLAFFILVHKDPVSVIQQLRMIYNPAHVYVYHVDKRRGDVRRRLVREIMSVFPRATNVRVLSGSESFVPSWGSYGIVRAELQGFRTLLEYPNWEYIVKLSGADLPIRSVEDLTLTLAAYRGKSLVPTFSIRNKNLEDQGLSMDVWHGCGGFVFNVTRAAGQPSVDNLTLHVGSQWSVPHRSFIEYMFSSSRSRFLKRFMYYISTSIIPDEVFSATMVYNSPYSNTSINSGLHWLKQFQGKNALHLCRHTDDTDFCGQGPSTIETSDWPQLIEASHREFFARKFSTEDPGTAIRDRVAHHQSKGYYSGINKCISEQLIRHLIQLSMHQLETEGQLANVNTWKGAAKYKYRMLPRLEVDDPCCHMAVRLRYKIVQTFAVTIDWKMILGQQIVRCRSRLVQRAPFSCHSDGHLRIIRYTTWSRDINMEQREHGNEESAPPQLSVNLPLPYSIAPVSRVYVELWIHAGIRSIEGDCAQRRQPVMTPFHFPNLDLVNVTADPVTVEAAVEETYGKLRCYVKHQFEWNSGTVRSNSDKELIEMPGQLVLPCEEPLMQGKYKLIIRQINVTNARIYTIPLTVLSAPSKSLADTRESRMQRHMTKTRERNRDIPIKKGMPYCENCGEIGSFPKTGVEEEFNKDLLDGLWEVEKAAVLISKKRYQGHNGSWGKKLLRWLDDL